MKWRVLDHVELVIARDHALNLALDVDVENRGEEVTSIDELVQCLVVEADGLGCFAAAIYDAWYTVLTANAAGGPLACPAAHRGRELLVRCHFGGPFQ